MTADIVNLRAARKEKARAARRAEAAQNRAKFGRSKAERTLDEAQQEQAARRLDGHSLRPDDKGDGGV